MRINIEIVAHHNQRMDSVDIGCVIETFVISEQAWFTADFFQQSHHGMHRAGFGYLAADANNSRLSYHRATIP